MQRRLGTCRAKIGWCRDLSTFAFSRAVRRRRSVARTFCTTRTIAALQLLLVHHRLAGMLILLALACPPRDVARAAELGFTSTSLISRGSASDPRGRVSLRFGSTGADSRCRTERCGLLEIGLLAFESLLAVLNIGDTAIVRHIKCTSFPNAPSVPRLFSSVPSCATDCSSR
jgi:hypothetical protein